MNSSAPSQQTLDLIKRFEGCRLSAYKDWVGVLTIGYGHTGPDVKPGLTWTQAQADAELENDVGHFQHVVEAVCPGLNPNQLSACVSLAYNIGLHAFTGSTLVKDIQTGNLRSAAAEFLRWDKAGGQPSTILANRRRAEAALFSKP